MGLAEFFLGSQNPFSEFVASNRGAIRGAGMGLAQGPDFGSGLAQAAYFAGLGSEKDDAYAASQREEAIRQEKLQKAIDYLHSSNPQLAQMVSAGMDPNQAFEVLLRPDAAANLTDDIQEYQFAKEGGYAGSFSDWMTDNKGGVNVDARNMGTIPPGYQVEYDANNNPVRMAPIPGSPPAMEAEAAAAAEETKDARSELKGGVVIQDIDRALTQIAANPGMTTGLGAQLTGGIAGPAKDVGELLGSVKANAGFAELQAMREASPTGGALGQVTERELAFLQSTIGSLEQSQNAQQLADNLKRVKNAYLDIIHGPGNGPPRERLSFEQQPVGIEVAPEVQMLLEKYK